jgi:hypothetical protein
MVYLNKRNQRRVASVGGQGVYSKPLIVLATREDARKRATLGGKVWKRLQGTLRPKQAVKLKHAVRRYQNLLRAAGIKTVETKVVIAPTKNGFSANIIQPFILPEQLLEHRLRECPKADAIKYFRKAKRLINKVKNFNRQLELVGSEVKIGLDLKPENFAVINNEVLLLDLFPLIMTANGKPVHDEFGIQPISAIRKTAATFLGNTALGESAFIQKHISPSAMKARLIKKFSAIRPELRKVFIELSEGV